MADVIKNALLASRAAGTNTALLLCAKQSLTSWKQHWHAKPFWNQTAKNGCV